ncbi:MAG: DUF4304 domain-containing protein [Bdellovibrionota bacterium]|nr:MAG: DUF4304 domain-containing protein [Bdellovibrionota bacterium]
MKDRVRVLDAAIKEQAGAWLRSRGFIHDGKRAFRRASLSKELIQIVEFQIGLGAVAGKFTVNLGVYWPKHTYIDNGVSPEQALPQHCLPELSQRLGKLVETPLTRFFLKLFGPRDVWWKWLFAPRDLWWRFSENESVTELAIQDAIASIAEYGLPWLERNSTELAAEGAIRALEKRKLDSNKTLGKHCRIIGSTSARVDE